MLNDDIVYRVFHNNDIKFPVKYYLFKIIINGKIKIIHLRQEDIKLFMKACDTV
jgi:hypothetical protein